MKKGLLHIATVPLSLTFLRGQVGFMKEQGLEVTAITSPGEEIATFVMQENVQVFAVPMARRISLLSDAVSIWRIRRYIRSLRPLIVHAQTPKGGLLGMVAAWLARTPVRIYHMRGLPFMTASGWRRFLLRTTERISCALAHSVLCNSYSVRDVAIQEGLCIAVKIKVLAGGSGNGVDADCRFNPANTSANARMTVRETYGIPDNAMVLGFVGRLVRDKGVVELAEAWRSVRQEFANVHLLLVGPVESRDPVPMEVMHALQSDARVHFTGKQAEISPLYAAMDLVVLPTYREGFPNVPLEAAAMELPVIATKVPGCIDAVQDGVNGYLVEPKNATALAEKIRRYLRDAGLRRRHGKAGREWVSRKFAPQAIWQAMYNEYARVAEERGVSL